MEIQGLGWSRGTLRSWTVLLAFLTTHARQISVDCGANPESGDAWVFDSTGCEIDGCAVQ